MKPIIGSEHLPDIRTILHATAHHNGESAVIDEVIGWVWEELKDKDIAHMMARLMEWHALNGEPWPQAPTPDVGRIMA